MTRHTAPQVLITFLGRVPKDQQGYRVTRYDFGDGQPQAPAAFFGWPLRQHLGAERLVILGTAGSMWEHLFEGDHDFGDADEEARLALVEAVELKTVTAAHLGPLAPLLAQRLGCEVRLEIIPYAQDPAEQVALLRIMAAHVEVGDRVHLDVTHGFRHLPMLGVLSALHLRITRQAHIEGIWYGAYDPDTGAAPVHNLVGLLNIADWVQALHTYDKDGDYGAFADLLDLGRGQSGRLLREAAFFERTSNPVKAREKLTTWGGLPDRYPNGDSTAELFRDELEQRLAWVRGGNRAAWEGALGWQHLKRGDYVRAVIYGMEAVISGEVTRQKDDLNNFDDRDYHRKALMTQDDFKTLSGLRNALAHGVRPYDQRLAHMIGNAKELQASLRGLFRKLGVPR
ncbi:MAG: TIGR02221 family CRISPR-associated protein [Chromatiaceae bacterium]|nr:TIGR02221 family CRISPR-associated protein [Chromatiaceae bacterium]